MASNKDLSELIRPDFYYYLFLEPSSQENYKMKIKIYFGAFPVPSSRSQKIHKNEIKNLEMIQQLVQE
jgi:hypothetical protein